MTKAMLFIDGSWVYANIPELARAYGKPDFQVDFGKLPQVLVEDIAEQAGLGPIDLVRSVFFGSYAENCDPRDQAAVQRRLAFFARLKEDYNYEVETFAINYQRRRLRRADREPEDDFVPKEKCVDIALAVSLMYYAMQPGAMDIAVVVLGDRDFVPLLRQARRVGRRVAIASIYGSCADELADPADEAQVRDFDVIWLNDLLNRIELRSERQLLACQSPSHVGERRVWTTIVPRKGRRFICERCRRSVRLKREQEQEEALVDDALAAALVGRLLRGRIKNVIWDRGYGFIAADDGRDYFFHANALEGGLVFGELQPELPVIFEVRSGPSAGRAGAARAVQPDDGRPLEAPGSGAAAEAGMAPAGLGEDSEEEPAGTVEPQG